MLDLFMGESHVVNALSSLSLPSKLRRIFTVVGGAVLWICKGGMNCWSNSPHRAKRRARLIGGCLRNEAVGFRTPYCFALSTAAGLFIGTFQMRDAGVFPLHRGRTLGEDGTLRNSPWSYIAELCKRRGRRQSAAGSGCAKYGERTMRGACVGSH